MAFSGGGDVSNAIKLRPQICLGIVDPDIVEPSNPVRAPKPISCQQSCDARLLGYIQEHLVIMADHGVVGSGCRTRAVLTVLFSGRWHEKFPLVGRILQRVQIKGEEVIEEVAFYLSTENVDFGAQDVEGMAVPPWRS